MSPFFPGTFKAASIPVMLMTISTQFTKRTQAQSCAGPPYELGPDLRQGDDERETGSIAGPFSRVFAPGWR